MWGPGRGVGRGGTLNEDIPEMLNAGIGSGIEGIERRCRDAPPLEYPDASYSVTAECCACCVFACSVDYGVIIAV